MARVVWVLEHDDLPGPDAAVAHLRARGAQVRTLRLPAGEAAPALGPEAAGLIVQGGAAMVTDRPEWMAAEQALMREALARGLPMLCICLGAQMLADLMGAAVDWHPQRRVAFGFEPLRALPAPANPIPDGLAALGGNAQGFAWPQGAVPLAAGGIWPRQAFRVGAALALQFHPEVTRPILDAWQRDHPDLHDRPGGQSKAAQDADFARHDPALKAWLRATLDAMFGLG